ncbi:MAG: 2-hydroxychromene-2-carboxylate isomerase [Alphaproteobacteria bacterium]|nr:2-hydroxychromene-2-carboxylate isomerase [Alphaproteobacteria bacterium]
MAGIVEFLFDVVSPTAYLAHKRLPDIAERTGATIVWTPIFLGGVMQATGNAPPGKVPAKGKYMNRDMVRCAARFGIPFILNEYFPVNTLPLQRAAVALLDEAGEAEYRRFIDTCFNAIWADGLNMGDAAVAGDVLSKAGFDAETVLARASDPTIKEKLKANTDDAVARGVFGAPTFFVGEEMYFGQDRLDYVEAALTD